MIRLTTLLMSCWLTASAIAQPTTTLPPAEADAKARIEASPRHGEYVDVPLAEGKSVRAYVVYPESKEKAPVVIVIHEIYGLSDWIKSVNDQLAADGFIAVAPDFLSGRGPGGGGTEAFKSRDDVTQAVRGVAAGDVTAVLNATRDYALKLPSASPKFGLVGFCWGGAQSFKHAIDDPSLGAAVVYYGTSPAADAAYDKIQAPVLGLYGSDDARVNATVPPAQEKMKTLGKTFDVNTYDKAGHGFLRGQTARDGANKKAAEAAWPTTIAFLKKHLQTR